MTIFELNVDDENYIIEVPTRISRCMSKLISCNQAVFSTHIIPRGNPVGFTTEQAWFRTLHILQNKPNTNDFTIDRHKFIQMYLYDRRSVYNLMLENVCFEIK